MSQLLFWLVKPKAGRDVSGIHGDRRRVTGRVAVASVESCDKGGCERDVGPFLPGHGHRELVRGSALLPVEMKQFLSSKCREEEERNAPWRYSVGIHKNRRERRV